jgi:NCAIR mutase (PurE)-related protein
MNKEIEKAIIVAGVKGVMHAVVVPLVILFMVNIVNSTGYGIASALVYLAFAAVIYANSTTKDISKMVFFGVWKGILVLAMLYALMVIS